MGAKLGLPNTSIAVAAHKPYWMPSDPMYVPVQAGALGRNRIDGYRSDAEGDGGISALNPHLSELTVLWWAWEHLAKCADANDAVGLVHYRRHFAGSGEKGTLTSAEAADLLSRAPILLPKQRNYVIETLGSHYDHTFGTAQLDLLIAAVAETHPESSPVLYRRLSSTRGHMFNMFIMRADLLCAYCEWAFPVVLAIEERFDYEGMSAFDARSPGRLSEFLVDAWLASRDLPYLECPVRDMEPINWAKKGSAFLAAKFMGRKYVSSF